MKKINNGFTLIELLIVVAIIAILAAIAIPNFLAAQTRARVAEVKSDMRTTMVGLESYYVDNNVYVPTDGAGGGAPEWWPPGNDNYWEQLIRLSTPVTYITKVPIDKFSVPYYGYRRPFYYESDEPSVLSGLPLQPNNWFGASWPIDSNSGEANAKWPGQMGGTKWMLWSCGPDLQACWTQSIWPYRPYDPTNGVNSKGDIWRLGPGNYGFQN